MPILKRILKLDSPRLYPYIADIEWMASSQEFNLGTDKAQAHRSMNRSFELRVENVAVIRPTEEEFARRFGGRGDHGGGCNGKSREERPQPPVGNGLNQVAPPKSSANTHGNQLSRTQFVKSGRYFSVVPKFARSQSKTHEAEKRALNQPQKIEQRLTPLKEALLNHRIYNEIDRIDALRLFMEHHVFAVWDFMSLLKVLQRQLCCVEVPWLPSGDQQGSRFINEIVLAEESDEDGRGGFASHFELYHRSMKQCGANTAPIDGFMGDLRRGVPVLTALASPAVPEAARRFVKQTFKMIETGDLCSVASAFTFGREDLLPDVFQRIVDELNTQAAGQLDDFKYYLDRHIGLDGDEHGPMATRLLQSLCGADDALWEKAEQAAVDCLLARQELWTGIYDAISREGVSLGSLDPAASAPQQ